MRPSVHQPAVFYGICGEGLGHLSRAAFLIPRLVNNGYDVDIFTSNRIAELCRKRFPLCRVHKVPGLRMHYRSNRIDVMRTTINSMQMFFQGALTSPYVAWQVRLRRPMAVISDYEPVVAWTAFGMRIPIITLDHQQIATECSMDYEGGSRLSRKLLQRSNRLTYPKAHVRIITSFFDAPLRKRRTSAERHVIAPVLRPEVLSRQPTGGSHVVVYQTSRTFQGLDQILNMLPGEKRVYGVGAQCSGVQERPFSEAAFLDDLASCRLALVNGGHTTISEALYYGKPLLCFPVQGQAEQEINAHHVAHSGYGRTFHSDGGGQYDITDFLKHEQRIRETIAASTSKSGNQALEAIVLEKLSQWHQERAC